MQDRVPLYPGRVKLTPVSGQENTYDMVRADQPTQEGTPLNKANLLSDDVAALLGLGATSVPNDAFRALSRYHWKLIQEYRTAGPVEFTVPDNVTIIGVYQVGGGASGAAVQSTSSKSATGGASGYAKNSIFHVTPGQKITGIVGAGGESVIAQNGYLSGNAGGSTSFNGVVSEGGEGGKTSATNGRFGASGGQGSDAPCMANYGELTSYSRALYGSVSTENSWGYSSYEEPDHGGNSQPPSESQNAFDPLMVSLSAGGWGCSSTVTKYMLQEKIIAMPDGTKGGNGRRNAGSATAESATGNGNGGGAAASYGSSTYKATSGAGSDGMILIYTLAYEEDWT